MKLKNSIIIFMVQLVAVLLLGCSNSSELELAPLSQEESNSGDIKPEDNEGSLVDNQGDSDDEDTSEEGLICVHMSGAVLEPGLYKLPEGSRLYDGVMAAGGFTDDAALEYSNLAEVLVDGVKYHIYTEDEVQDGNITAEEGSGGPQIDSHYNTAGQLNINMATIDELKQLEGIGESKALAIIEYREANGSFKSIEEIMNVSGIGEGLFSRIQSSITVN